MSFDFVIAGVGGQPIDRMVEIIAAACEAAGQAFSSTAPRGVLLLGGSRLAQVSVGDSWSPVVTEDTGELIIALEVGEALRYAKYCAATGVALVDALALPPVAPRDQRPYPGPSQIEPALREVIQTVHIADFAALTAQAGASAASSYAFLLGAASRVKGLGMLADGWGKGLEAAKATEAERVAFAAGRAWGEKAKI
jgi:Pyruvate/2-oxoacid:ferredoxin oxidoreductase gamma subunit